MTVGVAAAPANANEATSVPPTVLAALSDPDVTQLANEHLTALQVAVTSPGTGPALLVASAATTRDLMVDFLTPSFEPLPLDGVHDSAIQKINATLASQDYADSASDLRAFFLSDAGVAAAESLDAVTAHYLRVLSNRRAVPELDSITKYSDKIFAAVAIGVGAARCLATPPVSVLCVGSALAGTLALQASVVTQFRNDASHQVTVRNLFCPTPSRCEYFGNAESTASLSSLSSFWFFDIQAAGGSGRSLGGSANSDAAVNTTPPSIGIVKTYDVFGGFSEPVSMRCYAAVQVTVTVFWTDGFASRDQFRSAKSFSGPCS